MPPPPAPSPSTGQVGSDDLEASVREVLTDHARLGVPVDSLGAGDSLVEAGLTSHASVTVMLALEDAFDVEFTPDLLTKATFATIGSMCAALGRLGPGGRDESTS